MEFNGLYMVNEPLTENPGEQNHYKIAAKSQRLL